jgi:AraC-like DNA-binding protein
MENDTLSDVLRSVRLRSALYFFVSCGGKWAAEAPPSAAIAEAVMPGADHVIEYHVVTRGECWAAIVGEPPRKLRRGDVILLTHGDPHVLSSAPGMRADPNVDSYFAMKRDGRPFRVAYESDPTGPRFRALEGGSSASVTRAAIFNDANGNAHDGGDVDSSAHANADAAADPNADARNDATALVCGFIGCDVRPFNPLIAALPRMLHLSAAASGGWSDHFVELAAQESSHRRPGSEALLERLSEMMFVDAVRRHVDTMPEHSTGWLAGLRDRHVGRALTLLHAKPAAPWTLDELSRQTGLSRSALHERFVALVGQPAMQYLTNWRMQIAARMLRSGHMSVAAIAAEVGYDSEAAFSRAFKRLVGAPPAAWRRAQEERVAGTSRSPAP